MNTYRIMISFGIQSALERIPARTLDEAIAVAYSFHGVVSARHYPLAEDTLNSDDFQPTEEDQQIAIRAMNRWQYREYNAMQIGDEHDNESFIGLRQLRDWLSDMDNTKLRHRTYAYWGQTSDENGSISISIGTGDAT